MTTGKNRSAARVRRTSAGPDFRHERAHAARLGAEAVVFGVDEVGRGPLAGPVLAAAARLSPHAAEELAAQGLDDSKKLPPARRAALLKTLLSLRAQGEAEIALSAASVAEIERINILRASHLAMRRAVCGLWRRLGLPTGAPGIALIDGDKIPPGLPCAAEALVGGDGAALSIAAAALVAKETRDRLMRRLAARYPGFGWERNAGYGAPAHRAAILSLGLTPHHRRGFCRRLMESGRAAREETGSGP